MCTPFAWDRECKHGFDTFKKALCNDPVLALPEPKPDIGCRSMLANMHCVRCSPRCKIRHRRYWVITAINYTMWRSNTLHTTEYYLASEKQ